MELPESIWKEQYPQSIVCEAHPGRKAVSRKGFHGERQGQDIYINVCQECSDDLDRMMESTGVPVIDFQQ